ncbi:hypothetical protein AVEN_13208-1, partial [Araneus ventricosus]
IVDGYLRYIFNNQDLILPDVTVNDGKWHSVEATWFPNWLLLSLDYGQYIVKKIMKANIRGMYIGKVSVGGVENPDDEGKIAFFIGCIQNKVSHKFHYEQTVVGDVVKIVTSCFRWYCCLLLRVVTRFEFYDVDIKNIVINRISLKKTRVV